MLSAILVRLDIKLSDYQMDIIVNNDCVSMNKHEISRRLRGECPIW